MDYAKMVTELAALGPIGYILIALLGIGAIFLGLKKKKKVHEKEKQEAGAHAATDAKDAADEIKDGRKKSDDFLGR